MCVEVCFENGFVEECVCDDLWDELLLEAVCRQLKHI